MLITTLNAIEAFRPVGFYRNTLIVRLHKKQPDDDPLPLLDVLSLSGFAHALWCVRVIDSPALRYSARLAVVFAEQVRPYMPHEAAALLDVTRRYLCHAARLTELSGAADTARSPRVCSDAERVATRTALRAADAAHVIHNAAWASTFATYAARVGDNADNAGWAMAHGFRVSPETARAWADTAAANESILRHFLTTGEIP